MDPHRRTAHPKRVNRHPPRRNKPNPANAPPLPPPPNACLRSSSIAVASRVIHWAQLLSRGITMARWATVEGQHRLRVGYHWLGAGPVHSVRTPPNGPSSAPGPTGRESPRPRQRVVPRLARHPPAKFTVEGLSNGACSRGRLQAWCRSRPPLARPALAHLPDIGCTRSSRLCLSDQRSNESRK